MAFTFFKKFKDSLLHRRDLDELLSSTPARDANLKDRIRWTEDLMQWIRSRGRLNHNLDFKSGAAQAARLRYLLQVLDRNPEWKANVSYVLRSIIRDTKALDLFTEIGLSSRDSFWGEFFGRLNERLLPQPPRTKELSEFLNNNFNTDGDVEWVKSIDDKTFLRVMELFQYQVDESQNPWAQILGDIKAALLLLSHQIKGLGIGKSIRKRLEYPDFRELPFYQLSNLVEEFLNEPEAEKRTATSRKIDGKIFECFLALRDVHNHMDEYGVNVHIVYQIERLELMLGRARNLNAILMNDKVDPGILFGFIETLIGQHRQRHSLSALFSDNFSLLARRISERTAETGEHYITRNKAEHFQMFQKSFGGGFLTSFTILLKFFFSHLGLSQFYSGLAASLNYSGSFLVMHFAHLTLGTKQPAMTAPALADKMNEIQDAAALESLVDEIVDIIRSQITAVLGNIAGVLPFTIGFGLLWELAFNRTLLGYEKSVYVLESFSILGPTPIYAAFTGVLLWLSSIIAGWADNWFAYNQLRAALAGNRRLIFVFGEKGAQRLALIARKNITGIASSISLGFLLGMTPVLLQFLGIPLDVRHVTLSTGSVAVAVISFSAETFPVVTFWLAVAGVASMGVLNILVAFSLALFVAIRARRIQAPGRKSIYRALLRRLVRRPLSFIYPPKK